MPPLQLHDYLFQPTPPARTETFLLHSLQQTHTKFQPTPPARTETRRKIFMNIENQFQPTPPARTETGIFVDTVGLFIISTHSAREDGDTWDAFYRLFSMDFNPLRPRGRRLLLGLGGNTFSDFNPLRPRGRRQQYYTKKQTILHHISTIKSHHTPSNHRQPALHTSKTVLTVQFFRCESPRKFMFASGSHQTI